MRIVIYLGHPAHFHLFKNLIGELKQKGHEFFVFSRDKDVLDDLLKKSGIEYTKLLKFVRGKGKFRMLYALLRRNLRLYFQLKRIKPDIILSAASDVAHVAQLYGAPSLIFNDDDIDIVPYAAKYGWRYATYLVCPEACDMGSFLSKTITYPGHQKLSYLHENVFKPDFEKVRPYLGEAGSYCLIRTVSLNAHHDEGVGGMTVEVLRRITLRLKREGRVFVSAEGDLPEELADLKLEMPTELMHHAIAFSRILIGDSQSMAVEAALLGVPSIRFSDFAGRIGVLEELEHKFGLTFGVKTSDPERAFERIDHIMDLTTTEPEVWREKRRSLLAEVIDLHRFMVWLVEEYPKSAAECMSNRGFLKTERRR